MSKKYLFFDTASTTPCCAEAIDLICRYAHEDFGNPSSSHAFGQQAARAIREARLFFASYFQIEADQVIFTGSGSEADNLAVYGVAMQALAQKREPSAVRVLCSATEHPAVRKTVESLKALGIDAQFIPVDSQGQIDEKKLIELATPSTVLVSIQQVNNITGAVLPVEHLAKLVKSRAPNAVFHTDSVQAFGKVDLPKGASSVDLVSVSAHKIEGPKGVGALLVLNKKTLQEKLRPVLWGGGQEAGFRSGTQNAGLIAGFHVAARRALEKQTEFTKHCTQLRSKLHSELQTTGLLETHVVWNSPEDAAPNIVSLSIPKLPSGPLAKLLEERGMLVSTGSACSSQKSEPDAVLCAMGLPASLNQSAIRISFSNQINEADVTLLVSSLRDSIELMTRLLSPKKSPQKTGS
jgi:cysteine desulfurase